MANNSANTSTANQLAFGQFGSTYLTATEEIDLTAADATRYVSAITVLVATKFAALENMDGAVGSISTVTAENDLDGTNGIGASGNGTNFPTDLDVPVGITLYGKWDKVTLGASGSVICYFAPRTVNNV